MTGIRKIGINTHIFGMGGGGLAAFKSKMAFWGGDFDFATNQWLDQSDNDNHADLVGGNCITITNNVTITLQDAKVGSIVTELNGSTGDTAGVTVNGSGHIDIVAASLTVSDIWQIKLSEGAEIRLTSGVSNIVFYDGNYAEVGGTEDTDWAWSTTDTSFANLEHGCSKYVFVNDSAKRSFGNGRLYQREEVGFELLWEGYLLEVNANLCGIDLYPEVYGYSLFYATNSRIVFANRETGFVSPRYNNGDGDVIGGWVKIKIAYNGGGYDSLSSWKMYLNDQEKTIVDGGIDYSSRTKWDYAGHDNQNPKCFIKNHYYKRGVELWQPVYNGVHSKRYGDAPDGYIYIPADNQTDFVGQTALNPAYTDSHNGCEVKVKMNEAAALIAADTHDYLFDSGDNAREMDMTQFYPNLNDIIQVNITSNRFKDLLVMTDAVDLYRYINGLRPMQPYCSFRTDTSGQGDVEALLDYVVANERGVSYDAHCTYPITIGSEYAALIASNRLAIAIHDLNPAFWRYATYEEGKYHYDNVATAGEIADGTVIENQGRIGYSYGAYDTPKETIEAFYTLFGKAYPGGTPPSIDDNNEDWWEWVIEVYAEHIADNGGILQAMSTLGALPTGLSNFPHIEAKKILNQYITPSSFSQGEIASSDDLANSNSIFSGAQGDSIVEDGGVNCQKLAGVGGSAYGEISIGSDENWKIARNCYLEFYIKQTAGGAIPFPTIFNGYYNPTAVIKPNGAAISIGGVDYTDVMSTDTWYKIRVVWSGSYYSVLIYDSLGDCLLFSDEYYASASKSSIWSINVTDSDILIKNVSVYADFHRLEYEFLNHAKWDDEPNHTTETYEQWKEIKLLDMIDKAYRTDRVAALFSHYIQDPAVKDADGTDIGVCRHRSYNGFTDILTFLMANGFRSVNSATAWSALMAISKRNLILNGDFIGTLNGKTKASNGIFGMQTITIDSGELLNSIDGTNIGKIANTDSVAFGFIVPEEGWHMLQFFFKGDVRWIIDNGQLRDYFDTVEDSNRLTESNYTLMQIPFYINNCHTGELNMTAYADSWLHKLLIYKI